MHVNIYLIFDTIASSRAKLILCLLDLTFYVFLNVVDYVTNENRSNECIYFETNIIFMIFSFA